MQDDETKMQGYSKDMDTLLVFAALYSAILTAFVVETYQMLQQSPSDVANQLLAANNKMLRDGFTALISPHSSVPPTFSTAIVPPFQPSSAARWINSLFFVSLVLSLSAAFLGIQIKQWIGEYMRWNLLLGVPSQNITIRQFRYEAWTSWRVDAVISIVPALLGLAMILFFVGVVILLWTLDQVVAICGTMAAATFLLIFAAFTILPVFSRRCPYRTPTVWALLLAWKSISRPISFALQWANNTLLYRRWRHFRRLSRSFRQESEGRNAAPSTTTRGISQDGTLTSAAHLHSTLCRLPSLAHTLVTAVYSGSFDSDIEEPEEIQWPSLPASWRDHDLYSLRDIPANFGSCILAAGDMRKLEQAILQYHNPKNVDAWGNATHLKDLIPTSITPLKWPCCKPQDKQKRAANRCGYRPPGHPDLHKLREFLLLLRALGYVSASSQNAYIDRYLAECIPSLLDGDSDAQREPLSRDTGKPFWVLNLEYLLSHKAAKDLAGPTVATSLPYLRQFVLARTSQLPEEHADVYRRVIKKNRVTYKNGRLEVRNGHSRSSECEIILLDYFPENVCCHTNALMLPGLLVTFARWIQRPRLRGASITTIETIMRKVIRALEALLARCTTEADRQVSLVETYGEDLGQIVVSFANPKNRSKEQRKARFLPLLSACDPRLCRRLMHLLESLHQHGMVRLPEREGDAKKHPEENVDVTLVLHDQLKEAHKDQICEVAGCPWVIRRSDGEDHRDGCDRLHDAPAVFTPALLDSSFRTSSSTAISSARSSMLRSPLTRSREHAVDGSDSTLQERAQGAFDISPFSSASTLATSHSEEDTNDIDSSKMTRADSGATAMDRGPDGTGCNGRETLA
ncbi:hypothetical protein PsYK624_118200 [Phanerochaete sordida]|uniref:DUF6535 domain-containing protein n=1 Tax=Phanerochaete sordida TaxID=48140 RepID=A0A9P3LIG2_9APHY|nr:hypothetical protein PsYK624_118200 [Phanerochaete sordida]